MKETLLKAGLSGGIALIGSNMLLGNDSISLFGTSISSSLATGLAVGAGSIASDLVSENLIDSMNLPQNIKTTEEVLLRVGLCGAASSAVMMYMGAPLSGVPIAFATGAGSKLAGDYVDDMFFSKRGMMPLF
jgi:hypothetical protein